MDAVSAFDRAVARYRNKEFAFDRVSTVTYGEASQRADAVASRLKATGVRPGAAVALCSPDSIDLLVSIIGIWKAGAMPSMIDAGTSPDQLPYFLKNIDPGAIYAAPANRDALTEAGAGRVDDIAELAHPAAPSDPLGQHADHSPESPLFLSYTSGTTGDPKGAVLKSGPVALGTACIADRLDLASSDVMLATTPTSSSFQLVAAVLPSIHRGAALGLVSGLAAPELWRICTERSATIFVGYPLTLADFAHADEAGTSHALRMALSGGSPLAPRIKRDYRELLGIPLVESYGQSELGGFMALGSADATEHEYVGRPLPDRVAYIGDETGREVPAGTTGEVLVPDGYFAEYWNKPEETKRATDGGVLHCGDLGIANADGYLRILGRVSERKKALERGVFLRDVEDAFYEHPSVHHSVVVETQDGQVGLFVELLPGAAAGVDELREAAAASGCTFQPDTITVVEQMPRTFSGKANRRQLAELARD